MNIYQLSETVFVDKELQSKEPRMSKYMILLIFLVLSTVECFAESLTSKLNSLNKEYAVKGKDSIGYDLEFRRSENGKGGWINIVRVKNVCEIHTKHVLVNKQIVIKTTDECRTYADTQGYRKDSTPSLFQITCFKHNTATCIDKFANQLTKPLIDKMVNELITDVEVE